MADTYDVIVVGSGHNGLIAAAYLARGGQKVLVLERNDHLGGGVTTAALAAPGYRHDWHSATHIVIQANPVLRNDELGLQSRFGLKYIYPEGTFSTVFDDQDSIVTYTDVDRTCESIARVSPRDAEAYRAFAAESAELLPIIVQGMFVPPLPQGPFWALLDQSAEGRKLMQVMGKSMLDIVNERFTHDKVKVHLLKFACEMLVGPDEKGTGAVIFNMPGFVHAYPSGVPVGGSAALVEALVRCLQHHGAEFRLNSPVEKVLVSSGRATGVRLAGGETLRAKTAVIGQIHPWLLSDMVEGLDPAIGANARQTIPASFSIMASHFALREMPKYYAGEECSRVALMNFAPATLEGYMRIFDDVRYGDLPSRPIMAAHNNVQFDPSRAPAGGSALTIFGFGPYALRDGGAAAWDGRKEEMGRWQRDMMSVFCSNLTDDNIVGHAFHSPLDVERHTPTFQRGDVGGVGKFFHQIGGHRPTPELAQYAVPGIERLYLAGTFMHPPGGVTGGGRATAMRMCEDLGMDFDKLAGG